MSLQLLFLGTGTSAGVPMIGCDCEVCRSPDPRDKRDRPSVLISYPDHSDAAYTGQRRLLIDATAEIRPAAVRHGIDRVDGVLITHAHADHVFGLDDLRRFNLVMGGPLDLYGDEATHQTLVAMFHYIFRPQDNVNKSFVPQFVQKTVGPGKPFDLFGATWTPLLLLHGRQQILGFRVDIGGSSLAYCTDVSRFPPETYPLLEGLDVFVVDALRYRHHPTHLTVDQALGVIDQVKPGRAYLTHIAHDIKHADLEFKLPEGVYLPHDGLVVECD